MPVRGERDVDEPRAESNEVFDAEAEVVERDGPIGLDEHVAVAHELEQLVRVFAPPEVERA